MGSPSSAGWYPYRVPPYRAPALPDPAAIFGAQLISWVRADDNPAGAASWPNRVVGQSALSRVGAAPAATTFGTAPALRFDGTNGYNALPLAIPSPVDTKCELITVFRLNGDVDATRYLGVLAAIGTAYLAASTFPTAPGAHLFATGQQIVDVQIATTNSGEAPVGGVLALSTRFDFATQQTNFVGAWVAADASAGPDSGPTAPLDSLYLVDKPLGFEASFIGDVAEQLVVAPLSDASQRTACWAYFAQRYPLAS